MANGIRVHEKQDRMRIIRLIHSAMFEKDTLKNSITDSYEKFLYATKRSVIQMVPTGLT